MFLILFKNNFRIGLRKLVYCGYCICISRLVNEFYFSNNFIIKRNKIDFYKWCVVIIRK